MPGGISTISPSEMRKNCPLQSSITSLALRERLDGCVAETADLRHTSWEHDQLVISLRIGTLAVR